jgi:uncharacterized protein (TIGR02271 family)
MSSTVVGLFRTPAEAQRVKQLFMQEGFSPASLRVLSNESDGFAEAAVAGARTTTSSETGMMASIKNFFSSLTNDENKEEEYYTRGVSAGGALLAVTVDDEHVESVASLLEAQGAQDVTEEGAANTRAGATAKPGTVAAGEAVPVVEEELQVGKRQVLRGGIRVYSRVVETPVEENVQLREEHVRVERTAVDRPVSAADLDAFKEGTIELTETGEEVVVAKQARVVEEVTIGKDVSERTQTIKDSVRHTEVDVEKLPADEKRKSASRS